MSSEKNMYNWASFIGITILLLGLSFAGGRYVGERDAQDITVLECEEDKELRAAFNDCRYDTLDLLNRLERFVEVGKNYDGFYEELIKCEDDRELARYNAWECKKALGVE